jgi:hypothetical protein
LDAEKEEAGTARVKTRAGESIENLGDGKLDSGVIFKDREAEGFFGLNGRLRSEPMDVGVKVAIGLACKSRRPAFRAIGHNVPAFVIHELIPLQKKNKKMGISVRKLPLFNGIGGAYRCKFLIRKDFFADSRQQRGYGRHFGASHPFAGAFPSSPQWL